LSEKTAEIIDDEVHALVMSQYRRARGVIESNRVSLYAVAEALLEHEVLDGAEVDEILEAHGAKGETTERGEG